MTFIARVKKIDIAALRAHRAFPLVVTGWLVLLLGAGAYIVQGSALHAALGAIAGGLLGRYLVTRMGGAAESAEEEASETERDKRLRRVLGPDEEEGEVVATPEYDAAFDENPDADLDRILASRSYRPKPVEEVAVEAEAAETIESEPELAQDAEPQYLSIEELKLEGAEIGFDADTSPDTDFDDIDDDGEDDGSDDAWPAEAPEWANPGAALAVAHGASPEPIDEPALQTAHQFEPVPQPEIVAEPGEQAAAKLRAQDLSQMSLVQMIERLAFAMDDYREIRNRKPASTAAQANQQAEQMAETLRSLPALARNAGVAGGVAGGVYATDGNVALDLSTREEAEATEDALRDALEKLQKLSGG